MAARVNTRFIAILVLVLLVAGGGLGALWYINMKGDTDRLVREGDEAMADGDVEKALRRYGRASRKEPANLDYLQKVEDVLLSMRPDTRVLAQERYGQYVAVLRQRAQYHPTNAEVQLALVHELHLMARSFNFESSWNDLEIAANSMRDRLPATDPAHAESLLYSALSVAKRQSRMDEDEVAAALEDIDAYLEQVPDSDLGWAVSIEMRRNLALKVLGEKAQREAQPFFDDCRATMEAAAAAVRNGFNTGLQIHYSAVSEMNRDRTSKLDWFRSYAGEGVAATNIDVCMALLEDAISNLSEDSASWELDAAFNAVGPSQNSAMYEMVAMQMETYIAAHPESLLMKLRIGELSYYARNYEESIAVAREVLEAPSAPVSVISSRQGIIRARAAELIADVEFVRWDLAEMSDKAQFVEQFKAARDELATHVTDPEIHPGMLEANGIVAYMEGDYSEASRRFELLANRLAVENRTSDIKILLLAAESQRFIGNIGRAHEHVTMALKSNPDALPLLSYKARLEIQMGLEEQAKATTAHIRQLDPTHPTVMLLDNRLDDSDSVEERLSIEIDKLVRKQKWDQARQELAGYLNDPTHRAHLVALRLAATLEFMEDNHTLAQTYVEAGLKINPDDGRLKSLERAMAYDNPIDLRVAIMDELDVDEGERAARLLDSISNYVRSRTRVVAQLQEAGDFDRVEKIQGYVEYGRSMIPELIATIESTVPDHRLLFQYRFEQAINNEDWARADELANQARQSDFDGCGGRLVRAQLFMARKEFRNAIGELEAAVEALPFSVYAWRSLGDALAASGNDAAALNAYREAYRYNPRDGRTIDALTRTLRRQSEYAEALDIIRSAHNLDPRNPQVAELRYGLELIAGDKQIALANRERTWEEYGDTNRENAIGLVRLYSSTTPERPLILDTSTDADSIVTHEERFTQLEWQRLSGTERAAQIATTKESWLAKAEEILNQLDEAGHDPREVLELRAGLLADRGRVSDAADLLRTFVYDKEESTRTLEDYIMLANFLIQNRRLGEVEDVLLDARSLQGEEQGIDLRLGEFYYLSGDEEKALEYFEGLTEVAQNGRSRERIIDLLTRLGRFDDARAELDALSSSGMTYMAWMLDGAISQAEGYDLLSEGKRPEAYFKFGQYQTSLEEASKLQPTIITPSLHLAEHFLNVYTLEGEPAALEDAMDAVQEAERLVPNRQETSSLRVRILVAQNNTTAAISELTRAISRDPSNYDNRLKIIELHLKQGNLKSAEQAVRDAIVADETVAQWWLQLGAILRVDPRRRAESLEAYRKAHEIGKTVTTLTAVIESMILANTPGRQILAEFEAVDDEGNQTNSELMSGSGRLMCLHVRALTMARQMDEARTRLRQAFTQFERESEPFGSDDGHRRWFGAAQSVFNFACEEIESEVLELIDGDPHPAVYEMLSTLWVSCGDDGLDKAIALINRAIDEAGSEGDPKLLAAFHYRHGQFLQIKPNGIDAAIDAFRLACDFDENAAGAANNYAYLVSEIRNQPEVGLPFAERAVRLSPREAAYLDTLGWILYRVGRNDDAVEYLSRSLTLRNTPETNVHLAEVYVALNQFDRAGRRLAQAEQMNPSDETKAEIQRLRDDIRSRQ